MSDDTTFPLPPPPGPPAEAIPPPPLAPASEPSALKSLLNPIQSGAATPSSTIVEAPRSPQPPPQSIAPVDPPLASVTSEPNGTTIPTEAPPPLAPAPESAITSGPAVAENGGDASLPPLPADAPVPPSPKAADEPVPSLPPSAIPSAVPTPTVITTEADLTPAETTPLPPALPSPVPPPIPAEPQTLPPPIPVETVPTPSDPAPAPITGSSFAPAPPINPTPAATADASSGVAEPAPTPVEATPAPAEPVTAPVERVSEPMEVDEPVSTPSSGIKRSGDDLEGREEKRVKEEETPAVGATTSLPPTPATEIPGMASAVPAPSLEPPQAAPATAETPAAPVPLPSDTAAAPPPAPGAPLLGTVPAAVPPAPEAFGPTTPLTGPQHKHMLNAVRNLKKSKDSGAFHNPVDPIAFGIPHYPQFITKPMDLGTVETKLVVSDPRGPPKDKSKMGKWDESKGKYASVAEVTLDVRQIWWNTARFNGMDHPVTQAANRLEVSFSKALKNLPSDTPASPAPPPPPPQASAGPSQTTHARRQSVSQVPLIRRTSEGTDRPKREIHPPPSKDLAYAEAPRKPKRRNDPQLQWALRTLKQFEGTQKTYDMVSPFLYPVEELIRSLHDYGNIIKKPIDLIQIKAKLDDGVYDDISQVDADIKLMVENALLYNPPHDPTAISATRLGQTWQEKLKTVPPKHETRESSEDPLAASVYDESDDDEEESKIADYQAQISDLQGKIEALRSKQAKRKANKQKRPKKAGGGQGRKQSIAKSSPGAANGHAKKPRKSKNISYRDDEDEEEEVPLTTTQKTDLASRIQTAGEQVLNKAIAIIQKAQDVGSDGEIELDIDSLPPHTIKELYILVVGPLKKARKSNYVPTGKKPGRKPGGPRKSMNEAEEAERIARMEAQLQSFQGGGGGSAQPVNGYGEDDSDSSEEEDSDLE